MTASADPAPRPRDAIEEHICTKCGVVDGVTIHNVPGLLAAVAVVPRRKKELAELLARLGTPTAS